MKSIGPEYLKQENSKSGSSQITERLINTKSALKDVHASKIACGKKRLMLFTREYFTKSGQLYYLIDNDFCYGILKLGHAQKVSYTEVLLNHIEELSLDPLELELFYGNKEYFFIYDFDLVDIYSEPRKIKIDERAYSDGFYYDNIQTLQDNSKSKIEPMKTVKLMTPAKRFKNVRELVETIF